MTFERQKSAEGLPTQELTVETAQPLARDILRGTVRLLLSHGLAPLDELPLPDGRRADVVAVSASGAIVIVEVKSSVADFRADRKWTAYRDFCDQLYFAVNPAFPAEILPDDTGLIRADRFGGAIVRDAPVHTLSAPRRKAMILRVARAAASRLARERDPAITQDLT
jgi:hypothetical protein